jgi:hypothetical protein
VMGSCQTAIAPLIKNNNERTDANIGRLMKNCESILYSLTACN